MHFMSPNTNIPHTINNDTLEYYYKRSDNTDKLSEFPNTERR